MPKRFESLEGRRLLSIDGAAAYLSVGRQTIRDYLQDGVLEAVLLPASRLRQKGGKVVARCTDGRIIKKILLDRRDLDCLVAASKGEGTSASDAGGKMGAGV